MNEELIKLLEKTLERVRNGEVTAIAMAMVSPDLSTGSAWELGASSFGEVIGAVTMLQSRMVLAAYGTDLSATANA